VQPESQLEGSVAMETVAHLIDHGSETDSGSATGSLMLTASPVLCVSKLCQNTSTDRWALPTRQHSPKPKCTVPLTAAEEYNSLWGFPVVTIPKPRVGVGGVCQ